CLVGNTGSAPSWSGCGSFSGEVDDTTNDSLTFTSDDASPPAGTVNSIYRDNTGDLNLNVITGKTYNVQVAGTDEYNFSATALALNGNNITGVGTAITATAGLTVTATGADLTLATATSGNINVNSTGGTIELQDGTNVTGDLDVSGALNVGGSNAFAVSSGGALTFTGVTTDITTGTNEALTIAPNGTGSVLVSSGVTSGSGSASGFAVISSTVTSGVVATFSSTSTGAASNTQTVLNVATSGANGTSGQVTYGATVSNTHTGTSATNIALNLQATGGTTNYALYTTGGTAYLGGNFTQGAWGLSGIQLQVAATTYTDSTSSGTVTNVVANSFGQPTFDASSATTYTNAATIYVANAPAAGAGDTITNPYALWVDAGNTRLDGDANIQGNIYNTAGSINITDVAFLGSDTLTVQFNGFNGYVGIGDVDPDYVLEVSDASSTTGTSSFAMSEASVAHGLTALAQTDVYLLTQAISTTAGGAKIEAFSDTDAAALNIYGYMGATDPTDSTAAIKFIGAKKNTTNVQDLGAAETVFSIANNDDADALTVYGNKNITLGGNLTVTGLAGAGTKCIHVDNSGLLSTAAADCGSGTAFSGEVDDATNDALTFTSDDASPPAGTVDSIFRDNTGDLNLNVVSGKTFNVQVAGTDEYNFSATALAMNGNNITGLGTALTAAAGLTITATSADLAFATSGSGNVTLAPASTGSVQITSGVTTGTTTTSALSLVANALTTGTGVNISSTSLTSGTLLNLSSNGTAAAASQTGLNISLQGTNGTGGITTYGAQISNTHDGTTSTNVALQLTASGGTTANYALLTNGGNVGIGDTSPNSLFTVGSGDLFQINTSGQVGSQQAPVSDYLFALAGTTGNDNSRIIDITQANNAAEDSYAIVVTNTVNTGTIAGGTARAVRNQYLSQAPTGTVASTSGGIASLNFFGTDQNIDISGTTLGNSSANSSLLQTYGTKNSITGTPVINNADAAADTAYHRAWGTHNTINITPTLTATSDVVGSYYGTFNSVSVTSSGAAGYAPSLYGSFNLVSGNLTTTGSTTHYGGYFDVSGSAVTNYGIYANVNGATNNYAAIFTGGNVGVGTTTPAQKLHVSNGVALINS
ncbi:MAG: hypothetical protein JNK33_04930, partial [Candidatus Doudnabacteria bacterium]|nr:hypothetical protein [Candidatus Doudnabacteria bacterium]